MQTIDLNTPHPSLPDTTRKAVIEETYSNHKAKYSTLVVSIENYLNGELISNQAVNSYIVNLRADNTTFVDPSTGNPVSEGTPGAWGEYDYIHFLETIVLPITNEDFKESVVLRAEQQGRFDV
jgi:hypothetical protein